MKNQLNEGKPIFLQVKENIEDAIMDRALQPGERVPSTNEFAAFYKINPATAAKGIQALVQEEILFKRRGVGMFVAEAAREKLTEKRRELFYEQYMLPLKQEAMKLGMEKTDLIRLLEREDKDED